MVMLTTTTKSSPDQSSAPSNCLTAYPSPLSNIFPTLSLYNLPSQVRIVEVGPRDGLQNEPNLVSTNVKVNLINQLTSTGLDTIEVTAFVSPKWVPQLSDAAVVMKNIQKQNQVAYPVLVPNLKGLKYAIDSGAKHIAIFISATEQFSTKNLNCTIDESLNQYQSVVKIAKRNQLHVRAYISCVVGCPYQGQVDPNQVAKRALQLDQMGCDEISLADTIGVGTPTTITKMIKAVLSQGISVEKLAIHCHDTKGMALQNVLAAMHLGVAIIDSSIAGLGGCPFAPGAPGNLATEDLVYMLQQLGINTGNIDLNKLITIGNQVCQQLQRKNRAKLLKSSTHTLDPTTILHLRDGQ